MIKFTCFLAALLFLSNDLFSQQNLSRIAGIEFYEPYDYHYQLNQREKEWLKKKGVQERTSLHRDKSGQQTKTLDAYDREGNLLTHAYYDKNNELISETNYSYNEQHRLIAYQSRYKKRFHSARFSYNAAGAITEVRGYNSSGAYFGKQQTYHATGKVLSTRIFEKDSVQPLKQLDYEYYPDQSLKAIHYSEKGKRVYTWVYDCKPQGEMLGVKTSDTTRICIREEFDADGHRVVWRQEFDKKGEPEKIKLVFDMDSTLLYTASFDAADHLKSETTFFRDGGELTRRYRKKGMLQSSYETVYNPQKQLVKKSSTYKNWFSSTWYAYENELMTMTTYLSGRQLSVTEYRYVFFQ